MLDAVQPQSFVAYKNKQQEECESMYDALLYVLVEQQQKNLFIGPTLAFGIGESE